MKKFLIDSNDDEGFDIAITNYIKSQDAKVDVDATIASLASILEIDAV